MASSSHVTPGSAEGALRPAHSIPLAILNDLASRFIINAPPDQKEDLIRMLFQVELAHWFYQDEYVNGSNPGLRSCTIREFAEHIFRHVPFLQPHVGNLDQIVNDWRNYKLVVPTYGAIILNEDLSYVLLVQGYGSKTSWGFPKGKVNESEEPHQCAVREVLEETGFDISDLIDPELYLDAIINDQTNCLYLIPGVPRSTKFQPKTKYEIRAVKWFPVSELPASKKDSVNPNYPGLTPNNLYMALPFVRSLRKWIASQGGGKHAKSKSAKSAKPDSSMTPGVRDSEVPSCDVRDAPHCPKEWSNFRFRQKDIIKAMGLAS